MRRNNRSEGRHAALATVVAAVFAAALLTGCSGGSGSGAQTAAVTPVPGRIATLNITNPRQPFYNPYKGLILRNIAEWIAKVRPEVIAFQEACVNSTKRIAAFLADEGLHYHVVHGALVKAYGRCGHGEGGPLTGGSSGNAILSANPVTASGTVKYSTGSRPDDEQRGYVWARTTVKGEPVTIYATQLAQHTGPLAGVRAVQVKELAAAAHPNDRSFNSIILGDFNTVPGELTVLAPLQGPQTWLDADPRCSPVPRNGCKPTQVGARKKLDYIWLKKGFYAQSGIQTLRTTVPASQVDKVGADEFTDHDLTYTDLRKASPAPSRSVGAEVPAPGAGRWANPAYSLAITGSGAVRISWRIGTWCSAIPPPCDQQHGDTIIPGGVAKGRLDSGSGTGRITSSTVPSTIAPGDLRIRRSGGNIVELVAGGTDVVNGQGAGPLYPVG